MAQPPLITVLGSLNMDLTSYVPHHPLPGETLTATSFAASPGGKGANQAIACSKLSRRNPSTSSRPPPAAATSPSASATVSLLGAVGPDPHGQTLLANLQAHSVDTSLLTTHPTAPTGLAIVIVDLPTGQNRIILSPEANHCLPPDAFEASLRGRGRGRKPALLITQLEIPLPTVLHALRTAKREHIPVLLNPAPAQTLPPCAYEGLAHLVVNETEACILSGRDEATLLHEEGLSAVASDFQGRGVRNVVVTLGERGVFYASDCGGSEKRGLVPAVETSVVDTTAAGDTFVGSYALAVVQAGKEEGRFDIEAAVRAANKASSVTVSRKGAQVSIPWRDEL